MKNLQVKSQRMIVGFLLEYFHKTVTTAPLVLP